MEQIRLNAVVESTLILDVIDLGRMEYRAAMERQRSLHERVSAGEAGPSVLLVEHDPVITISRRRGAKDHLLANTETLAELGITVEETDRGGDITYHGPGQIVAYPIVRLQDFGLNLGRYMRLLEAAVIAAVADYGVQGHTQPGATGVWVSRGRLSEPEGGAKLCAMGVRIRRQTTMHGLALNVTTDLQHFATIDPCGLGGRPVTSLERLLENLETTVPSIAGVKCAVAARLSEGLAAERQRHGGGQ